MNSAELVRPSIVFTARRDDFHIAPSVRRCVKIDKPGPDTFFAPRNRLKIRNCPARKGLSVPDFSIFSQLRRLKPGPTKPELGYTVRKSVVPARFTSNRTDALCGRRQVQLAGYFGSHVLHID